MLTEKDYCDYETCVELAMLGMTSKDASKSFNGYSIPKPLLYEAQKWLRERRLMFIQIHKMLYGGYRFHVLDLTTYTEEGRGETDGYEEALSEGIKEAIKLLKEEKEAVKLLKEE